MVYLYDASDQISDFCHQQLLRKMRRKISWTDGRMDRGKTVYPPPPSGSGGIKKYLYLFIVFGRYFQQYFSYIMATSFSVSDGRSLSTRREPLTVGKQLVDVITCDSASRVHPFL